MSFQPAMVKLNALTGCNNVSGHVIAGGRLPLTFFGLANELAIIAFMRLVTFIDCEVVPHVDVNLHPLNTML